MTDEQRFEDLLIDDNGYVCLSYRNKDGVWCEKFTKDKAALNEGIGYLLGSDAQDIYLGMATFQDKKRGKMQAVTRKTVSHDMDKVNKEEALEKINKFSEEMNLPKPYVLDSGNGLHSHWILNTPQKLSEWQEIADYIKTNLQEKYPELCSDIKPISDMARVLRPPGTYNYKDPANPKMTTVLQYSEETYVHSHRNVMAAALPDNLGVHPSVKQLVPIISPVPVERILKECAHFSEAMADGTKHMPYSYWVDCLNVLLYTEDKYAAAAEFSQNYNAVDSNGKGVSYDAEETRRTISNLFNNRSIASGPTKCSTLKQHNPELCAACPVAQHVKTPLTIPSLPENMEHGIPDPFFISKGSLWFRHGEKTKLVLTYVPYVRAVLRDKADSMHVQFSMIAPDGEPLDVTVPMELMATPPKLGAYIGRLGAVPADTKLLASYMAQVASAFWGAHGVTQLHNSFGWTDDFDFVLGDSIVSHIDQTVKPSALGQELKMLSANIKVAGDADVWRKEVLKPMIETTSDEATLAIFATMGAPLMRAFSKAGGAMVSLVGETGSGKSLIAKVAHSVWGAPIENVIGASDTTNSMYAILRHYNSLPVTMDEITECGHDFISSLLYMVTQGREKHRLTKESTLSAVTTGSWASTLLSTSNKSIIDFLTEHHSVNPKALAARSLEMKVDKYLSSARATEIVQYVSTNHGHLGPKLAQLYSKHQEVLFKACREKTSAIITALGKAGLKEAETRFMARIVATAYIAATVVAKLYPDCDARDRIRHFGPLVISELIKTVDANLAYSGVELVMAYLDKYRNYIVVPKVHEAGFTMPALSNLSHATQGCMGRIGKETRRGKQVLYIPVQEFKDYCEHECKPFKAMVDNLIDDGITKSVKGSPVGLYSAVEGATTHQTSWSVRCLRLEYHTLLKKAGKSSSSDFSVADSLA